MAFNNRTKEKVSIVNFLSVIGFAALFVLFWLGDFFLTGGEMAKSLLLAGGVTIIFVVLLIFLVKVKGATSDFRLWRTIEIVALLVYIGCAVFLSRQPRHFFEINSNKAEIKAQAVEDFNAIRGIFKSYEDFENEAISNTRRGILNSISGTKSKDLSSFYTAMKINPRDNDNVNMFCGIQKEKLLGNKYVQYKKENLDQVDLWESAINDWSVLRIPEIANDSQVANDIVTALSAYSKKADLPVITLDDNVNNISATKQVFSPEVPVLGLNDKLKNTSVNALILSIIVLIMVHVLILMSYFFAYRDQRQGFRQKVQDGDDGAGMYL